MLIWTHTKKTSFNAPEIVHKTDIVYHSVDCIARLLFADQNILFLWNVHFSQMLYIEVWAVCTVCLRTWTIQFYIIFGMVKATKYRVHEIHTHTHTYTVYSTSFWMDAKHNQGLRNRIRPTYNGPVIWYSMRLVENNKADIPLYGHFHFRLIFFLSRSRRALEKHCVPTCSVLCAVLWCWFLIILQWRSLIGMQIFNSYTVSLPWANGVICHQL